MILDPVLFKFMIDKGSQPSGVSVNLSAETFQENPFFPLVTMKSFLETKEWVLTSKMKVWIMINWWICFVESSVLHSKISYWKNQEFINKSKLCIVNMVVISDTLWFSRIIQNRYSYIKLKIMNKEKHLLQS